MRALRDAAPSTLSWQQPRVFKFAYELRAGCDVEIVPGALARPELPVLILLGWYLLLRMREDSAAAA